MTARKKTKLQHFEISIPKLTQDRFADLRELYAETLNNLTWGVSRRRGILMTLKVLGVSLSTATPWVFIQCDKTIAGSVRRFFKQPSVEADFKPANPDAYTPRFDIYVHELPPLPLRGKRPCKSPLHNDVNHTHEALEVYCEENTKLSSRSLCGSKITVLINDTSKSATIGGLISIKTKEGAYRTVGITAGHFLAEEKPMADTEINEKSHLDLDAETFDDEEEFELDLGSLTHETPAFSAGKAAQSENGETIETLVAIGHVFKTSQNDLQHTPNLDWALFTIENSSFSLPNIVASHKLIQVADPDVRVSERMVYLSTAMSGRISGMLSSSWSYLMLAPGNGLVRTNTLKMLDKTAFVTGDSGAWVVDLMTNELYGHLVASDVFGVGYVVPMEDIFKDIQLRLSLEAIQLPGGTPRSSRPEMAESSFLLELISRPAPPNVSLDRAPRYSDSGYSSMNNTPFSSRRSSPKDKDCPISRDR
ncbi:hypothetical protein F5882DRAFT_349369 [Hyaloscypha sp. PMI_1271]|nr:hypothetical protein F5882DRAFT_349369 [Hyaloscypha sp. PMI_1271]